MKIAVMGAGAVGCYFGAMLAKAGHEVTLIGRSQHVEAIRQHGLLLEHRDFKDYVRVVATTDAIGVVDADVVLFCVKSADTEAAGRLIAPHLKQDAVVLCLQNGVDNAERLQATINQMAVPAIVYVAAEMAGPGHVKHHGRGELIIGASPSSANVAATFTQAGVPTAVSDKVADELWLKLITNCAYNALSAVAQLPYGRLFKVDGVTEVVMTVVRECTEVASALDIAVPENIDETVLALAGSMPNQYSSTAQDLARGKKTEIDYLNGYVVRKGEELSIPTPANRALLVMVKLLEERAHAI
ncbi:MAG: 2-dehydropantoate 2-reductase [Candidatus Afipia apatlaquensis]|uniref:2-dehydropantoate 2-reductase n=1 Tax=Candidatus Afipia apatlaquensis TaxID=2712852 RepID=A0A7C9VPK1_9BRAD|nr:2-dehydropantoate 2-reductase [Candidatus Afipia apatlaquensis]